MTLRAEACRAAADAAAQRRLDDLHAKIVRVKELEQKVTQRVTQVLGNPPWLGEVTPTTHQITEGTGRFKRTVEYEALRFTRDGIVFKGVVYPETWKRSTRIPERTKLYVETWRRTKWHAIKGVEQMWVQVHSLAELGEVLAQEGRCP